VEETLYSRINRIPFCISVDPQSKIRKWIETRTGDKHKYNKLLGMDCKGEVSLAFCLQISLSSITGLVSCFWSIVATATHQKA
jgi:hypothetical protein